MVRFILLRLERGGFAGRYSGRAPGTTVINRGFDDITALAVGLEQLAAEGNLL